MMKGTNIKLATLALAGLGMVMSSCAYAMGADMKVASNGGIMMGDAEKNTHWFKVGGLLQLDQVFVDGDSKLGLNQATGFPNSANLRRARLSTEGGLGCHWTYYFGLNFAGPALAWDAVYLNYTGIENSTVSIGKLGAPFSLSNWASTADVLTLERPAAANAFTPADGLGIYANHQLDMLTFAAMVWAPEDGAYATGTGSASSPAKASDNLGFAGRITFAPVHTADYVLHAGVSGVMQGYNSKNSLSSQPFSTGTPIRGRSGSWASLTSTDIHGSVYNTKDLGIRNTSAAGLEVGALWGPFSMNAEYIGARVSRIPDNANSSYNGWYANVAYSLTGESRSYDFASGTLGAPKAAASTGAWELYAQYSAIDLRDHDLGALQNDTSAGVNWYINKNLRATVEYSHADMRRLGGVADKRELDLVGLRLQAKWS
jgi:phosphate-selective porin OprO/OprP